MKIDVLIPGNFEKKWLRLKSCYGEEELAMAAVDLLWERYKDDVKSSERLARYHKEQIRNCKKKMASLKTRRAIKES